MRPYRSHYRTAFAFCSILYPLSRQLPLRASLPQLPAARCRAYLVVNSHVLLG
jgi:hypothetical protein